MLSIAVVLSFTDAFNHLHLNSKILATKSLLQLKTLDSHRVINSPIQMVPSPVDNIEKDHREVEVCATAGIFFSALFYLKSFWWSVVLSLLSHYVVQKNSLFGNTLRAFGFLVYTVKIFVVDIYNYMKNNVVDSKTRENFDDVEDTYSHWRVNERVQSFFDFTDVSIDKLSEIFDSARKEL